MFDCVVLLTFDLDLRVAGGGVLCDQMEEGGEPGSWSALTRNLVSPGPRVAVEQYYFAPAASVAETRPRPSAQHFSTARVQLSALSIVHGQVWK